MNIADRIDIAMKLAGYSTQADLSRASGVPVSTLARILSGDSQPNANNLAVIAKTCKRSIDWIVNGTDNAQNLSTEVSLVYVTPEELKLLTQYREASEMGKGFIKIAGNTAEKQSMLQRPSADDQP